MIIGADQKKLNFDLMSVGLRAQATAAGLVQLCRELQTAGVIGDDAVGRIKDIVADNITLNAPRKISKAEYRREVGERLDAIFSGEQKVGDINELLRVDDRD